VAELEALDTFGVFWDVVEVSEPDNGWITYTL
jgi:hypothetical protein